jgi:phosphoribosylformylglycinamidine cyclo-ligase
VRSSRALALCGALSAFAGAVRKSWLDRVPVKGLAHITGGGFDNIDRVLPPGCAVRLRPRAWEMPAIFRFLQAQGGISEAEMHRTFNCGVGMALIVSPERVADVLDTLPHALIVADIV